MSYELGREQTGSPWSVRVSMFWILASIQRKDTNRKGGKVHFFS